MTKKRNSLPALSVFVAALLAAVVIVTLIATLASAASGDTQPPTAPSNLKAMAVNSSEIDLTWSAATDNYGVAGYRVYRSTDNVTFNQVADLNALSYKDAAVAAYTTYYYYAKAYDAAGNVSAASNTASATTPPSTCQSGQPQLALTSTKAYYASFSDQLSHKLSLEMKIANSGASTAVGVKLTGSTATNGVTPVTSFPVSVGDISGGTSKTVTLVYKVPSGVSAFKATVMYSANDACGDLFKYSNTADVKAPSGLLGGGLLGGGGGLLGGLLGGGGQPGPEPRPGDIS